MYFYLQQSISYLWYNVIGCGSCAVFSVLLQAALGGNGRGEEGAVPS
jgi:hypothetical protein